MLDHVKKVTLRDYLLVALLFLLVLGVYELRRNPSTLSRANVTIDNAVITVEVAKTEAERQKGLSGRPTLAEGRGMIFFFEHPGRHGFWMPDMRFPIDIVWINSDWSIVDMAEWVLPESYPSIFVPDTDAQYVLEVPAGSIKGYSWKMGDKVEFKFP